MKVSIYQLECLDRTLWRVMRDDGQQIMDCHQVDFEEEDVALHCVFSWAKRTKAGPVQIRVRRTDGPLRVVVG